MNDALLEALASIAATYYADAMHRHPALFTLRVTRATPEDQLVAPVLWTIDQLLLDIDRALNHEAKVRRPPPRPPDDDDIPF
jgi:hypothetical protein